MLNWLMANWATVLVLLIIAALIIGVIAVMVKDKKQGKSSCGGSCGGCPMSGKCQSNKR